jgi:lipoate-protein ligase B
LLVTQPVSPFQIVDLGTREFGEVWKHQLALVGARQRDEIEDTLLLVEHPHVITLGRSTKRENLLRPADTPIFEIERGGDITYHGPGQLVGYPIFKLRDHERDLHLYMRRLEETVIQTLATVGLEGGRRAGWTGVWTVPEPQRKLASIGVAVKKWVTLHGFALNVSTDLARFNAINPCGLDAAVMTSASACLGREVTVEELKPALAEAAGRVFERRLV